MTRAGPNLESRMRICARARPKERRASGRGQAGSAGARVRQGGPQGPQPGLAHAVPRAAMLARAHPLDLQVRHRDVEVLREVCVPDDAHVGHVEGAEVALVGREVPDTRDLVEHLPTTRASREQRRRSVGTERALARRRRRMACAWTRARLMPDERPARRAEATPKRSGAEGSVQAAEAISFARDQRAPAPWAAG